MVYVMGGVTYSELRVGYEVSNEFKSWEVFVGKFWCKLLVKLWTHNSHLMLGGSQILTPEVFLSEIQKLS